MCLKAELVGFPDGLVVGVKKKRGLKNNAEIWGWINWKKKVAIF